MSFRLREIDPHGQFLPQLKLELLTRIFPRQLVQDTLAATGAVTQRERKLNLETTFWLLVSMNLFVHSPLEHVLEQLSHGLRLLWPLETDRRSLLPRKSAISYRRAQLGVRPLQALFHQCCRPLATPHTPGAFFQGLRLMALDGHTQTVPDTPANARAFGRTSSQRGESAFPQVQCVSLCELGTHALVDSTFWPARTGEQRGAQRLLRSVTPAMLVLWDAGLHSYTLVQGVQARGAHVLGRLSAKVQPTPIRRLPDGSYLAKLWAGDKKARRRGEYTEVRVIAYTFTDPQAPGYQQRYRLLTTLLDPEQFPAAALAALYHERWEMELTLDEQETHQLEQGQPADPLRSRTPRGVVQELYGLLLAHYAVRYLMHEAACQAQVDPDRLSFTHALRVLQDSLPDFEIAAPELLAGLYQRLLRELADPLLPERQPRQEPRVVRRKVPKWPLKRLAHRHWPQPTRSVAKSLRLCEWGGAALVPI